MTITLTRKEAQQVLDALLWRAHANPDHNPDFINDAIASLRARLAQETPYEIGQRLYREGKGISDIPTAVYSDRNIADALHGYETARLALHDMNKAAEQNGEEL